MVRITLILGCLWVAGCSCGGPIGARRDAGRLGDAAGGGDSGVGTSDSGPPSDAWRDDAPSSPEICDGIDNDGDGVIDDVDRGGDGVCDCLRIATLGVSGTAGTSGVFVSWLDARSDFGAVDLGDAVLTPELLAPYQIILSQDI